MEHQNMNQIGIGVTVKRISGGYVAGRIGDIVEISGPTDSRPAWRARVAWSDSPRTWVRFSDLLVIGVVDSVRAVVTGEGMCETTTVNCIYRRRKSVAKYWVSAGQKCGEKGGVVVDWRECDRATYEAAI